jgi:hypothetical protein
MLIQYPFCFPFSFTYHLFWRDVVLKLSASHLQSRCSTTLATTPPLNILLKFFSLLQITYHSSTNSTPFSTVTSSVYNLFVTTAESSDGKFWGLGT